MNAAHAPTGQTGSRNKLGPTFAAAFQYTGGRGASALQELHGNRHHAGLNGLDVEGPPASRVSQALGLNGYNATPDLPPPIYVRALYNYDADDHTSLSFRQGDTIQVLTQLESGWWDGVINDVRGWFPSNYCTVISGLDDEGTALHAGDDSDTSADSGTEGDGDDYDEDLESDDDGRDGDNLPIEGQASQNQEEAAFWIPQATPDGRLFYFNTLTGVSTMELPLETPTSADETGPRDRTNFHVPDQTRPPPEMLAQAYQHHHDDDDDSTSDADVDSMTNPSQQRSSLASRGISSSTSMDSMEKQPLRTESRSGNHAAPIINSLHHTDLSMRPIGTTATSFSVHPQVSRSRTPASGYFLDEPNTTQVTWNTLVDNMRASVDAYRQAITRNDRAEFVRRAEDISDHLRLLLAAGSGTTDNHSGNPSIISTNKALYPHFREMMSKFSKLVLSSHIAAADWPGPEAFAKCLQEADGVMHGVYGYVEVARQQRGDEIPRVRPGFIHGSTCGGNWQDNNVDAHTDLSGSSFIAHDDADRPQPSSALDLTLLKRVDDARRGLNVTIRQLEEQIQLSEKLITPARQMELGDALCVAAGAVIDHFRPWIRQIESVNLAPLGSVFQRPQLLDFAAQKQKVYDTIGELVAVCQAVTAPLADEWAEVRGESLDVRMNTVRTTCRQLDSVVAQLGYALQLLLESAPAPSRDHRLTDGDLYQKPFMHPGTQRPLLADLGQSQSYSGGDHPPPPPEKFRRPNNDKALQFFGQMPPSHAALQSLNTDVNLPAEENPWYLQLDHQGEVSYDVKTNPPQLKSGTLTGLVEQLTRHDRLDASFNGTFLLTYRSFTTAQELFELLVRRFNVQPPAGLTRDELPTWEDRKQKPIRFRVVNILKSWFEHYWMENSDEASQRLLERAHGFAKTTVANTNTPGSGPLMAVIEQRMKGQDTSAKRLVLTLNTSAPQPIVPKNMKKLKFLDIDATEFARQLTIVESKLYGKIKPIECLDKTWQKKPKDDSVEPAPNVKSLILHSNQLTNWVAEMILDQQDVKKRVVVIKHFVTIADKCGQMNNFSTLTSIVSALGTTPIHRLNRTWSQVNPKTRATLEAMRQLMASTKNFTQYRERLHAAQPPCIPFLGVYLTDLTFIEDGIASVVKNTELINFAKRAKTAEVIRDIQQYQNVPYSLNPVPDLQEWIIGHMRAANDVHEMYNKSLSVEPREKEEDRVTRLLSESGIL